MTTASKITLARVALIPAFMAALLLSPRYAWLTWTALGLFILASLTDYVDGNIARKYNQVSDFGKFLDPLADKLLVISAMCIFCQWGLMPAWALMIVLTREFAVTGLRLIAVGKGRVIAAGWSGKIKTFSQMTMIHFLLYLGWTVSSNWFITAGAVWVGLITLWSGVEYFLDNRDILRAP